MIADSPVKPAPAVGSVPWMVTPSWLLVPVAPGHAAAVARLHARNGMRFSSAMTVEPGMDTADFWLEHLRRYQQANHAGTAVHLLGFARGPGQVEVGCTISFDGIVNDCFDTCALGFKLDLSLEGRGLMHEALAAAIPKVARDFGIHRMVATHLPENLRSARLLRRLGFAFEGYAREYIRIHNEWRDTAMVARLF